MADEHDARDWGPTGVGNEAWDGLDDPDRLRWQLAVAYQDLDRIDDLTLENQHQTFVILAWSLFLLLAAIVCLAGFASDRAAMSPLSARLIDEAMGFLGEYFFPLLILWLFCLSQLLGTLLRLLSQSVRLRRANRRLSGAIERAAEALGAPVGLEGALSR